MNTDYRALAIAEASVGEWHSAALAVINAHLLDYEAACEAAFDKPHELRLRVAAEASAGRLREFHEARDKHGDQAAVEAWLVTVKGAA